MEFLREWPDTRSIQADFDRERYRSPLKVNNHIHTPYSFSAFSSVGEAVRMAAEEDVKVLGINDFYVTDGYPAFLDQCLSSRLFPLFNIELIGISREMQQTGIRVNDPNNPGRTYISGKGLAYPSVLSAGGKEKLERVVKESNRQVTEMTGLLNRWLEYQEVEFRISVDEIMGSLARNLLRERHVARALRLKLEEFSGGETDFFRLIRQVYGGKPSGMERDDTAGLEDELRARLLKSGGPAYVPEDEKAFMNLDEIAGIVRDAGGIPTYPMLLDGTGGAMTEFERNRDELMASLRQWGFRSVELIPLRNRFEVLKEYAEYFYGNGFIVSFGTEHNTSAMKPLTVNCRDRALDRSLMDISFNGAAAVAAHQYLFFIEGPGYGTRTREELESLGHAIFYRYFQQSNY